MYVPVRWIGKGGNLPGSTCLVHLLRSITHTLRTCGHEKHEAIGQAEVKWPVRDHVTRKFVTCHPRASSNSETRSPVE
ncbi:hypothetical protein RRG08_018180 [Elysia crispata]|uniref:Uncharacterized protein n=1 Tax=Elysia crispata TaxID=231223 RepID=A0AAE0ZZA8_9GAST|nr:hypothetical protein RRG08_018180 [Elysia crispata]